jgi:hypothetical protein
MHTTARLLARLAIEELNAEFAYLSGTCIMLFMGRDGKVSPLPLGLSDEIQLQQCSN